MKRSEALASLSRGHHQGLFVALQLKRAVPETAMDARQVFLSFFEREGARHFRTEEEVLLPAYASHGEPDHAAVLRVLVEHVDLRHRARDLAGRPEPEPAELHELGERLESHIRHEERVLFPDDRGDAPGELERVAAVFERLDAPRE